MLDSALLIDTVQYKLRALQLTHCSDYGLAESVSALFN